MNISLNESGRVGRILHKASRRKLLAAGASVLLAAAALPHPARAELYWDANGAGEGGSNGTTASGNWGTSAFWSTASDGSLATAAWTPGETAVFSAGADVTGTSTITVSGTQEAVGINVEEGNITFNGGAINLTAGTLNATTAGRTITVNSDLSGAGGLNLVGPATGTAVSTFTINGAKTYTGNTAIGKNLIVNINNAASLGAAGSGNPITFATDATNSRLQLSGGITVDKPITLTGNGAIGAIGQLASVSGSNVWSGPINVAGTVNNSGAGLVGIGASAGSTLRITGTITSAPGGVAGSAFSKVGAGTLVLAGSAPNTHSGLTRVFGGTLILEKDGALGAEFNNPNTFDGGTVMTGTAGSPNTIAFRAPAGSPGLNYSTFESITLPTGASMPGLGHIDNLGGDNVFAGDLRLSGVFNSAINTTFPQLGVQSGSLELSGQLWGSGTSLRAIEKIGPGTLIISGHNLSADQPPTPPNTAPHRIALVSGSSLNVKQGTLILRSANPAGGNMPDGVTRASVEPSALLVLDNSLAVNPNRFGPNTTLGLAGGELRLVGHATEPVTQSFGAGVELAGYSTLTVMPGAAQTTLALGNINRPTPGTVLLRGFSPTSAFTATGPAPIGGGGPAGSPDVSILPFAVGDASVTGAGSDFVTLEDGKIRLLTASEYTPLSSGLTGTANSTASASVNIAAPTTVNSLKLSGADTTITIAPGQTLTLNSGALLSLATGNAAITGGNLAFGNEGIITVADGQRLAIASVVSGGNGLTKSGHGTLVLTGANDYSGKTSVNSGVLEFSSDNNLGQAGGAITVNGGVLRPTASLTTARFIELGSTAPNYIDVPAGVVFRHEGNTLISGTNLHKTGPGEMVITTFNTYTGPTTIAGGTITVAPLATLGTGSAIVQSGGTLVLSDDGALPTPTANIQMQGGTLRVAGGFTLTDPILLASGDSAIDVPAEQTLVYNGIISGSGNLVKRGPGVLSLGAQTGQHSYTGTTAVEGGTLRYTTGTNGLPALPGDLVPNYWQIANNAVLEFDRHSVGGADFSSGRRGVLIHPTGGTISVTGTHPETINGVEVQVPNVIANFAGISGSGTLTKAGPGGFALRVNNPNFTGKWNVTGGTLDFATDAQLGAVPTAPTPDAVTLGNGATLAVSGTGNPVVNANRGVTLAAGAVTVNVITAANKPTFAGGFQGPGSLTKAGPGSLEAAHFRTAGLTISEGNVTVTPNGAAAGASKVGALSIAPTSMLDLKDNDLVVANTPVAGVLALITTGYASGAWNGPGGIVTSVPEPAPGKTAALGYAQGNDPNLASSLANQLSGQSFDADDALVKYTYQGDADLDGDADIDDVAKWSANFTGSLPAGAGAKGWTEGDWDYDRDVDLDDVAKWSANFTGSLQPGAGLSIDVPSPISDDAVSVLAGLGITVNVVPEPASLSLLAAGALGLLRRARRRTA